jgi:hypothetical protein
MNKKKISKNFKNNIFNLRRSRTAAIHGCCSGAENLSLQQKHRMLVLVRPGGYIHQCFVEKVFFDSGLHIDMPL